MAINNASEVLQKTGYRITSLEIDIAMPPTISMDLNHKKEVDEATIQKLIDEYKRDKVINALLLTLQQGDKMQKSMQMATFVFNGIGMEIGLAIPHMKLKFNPTCTLIFYNLCYH